VAEDWPGDYRRRPPISSPTYAVRAPLAAWLREEAARRPHPYRVLDVGCGVKPYYPFFEPYASEYVGVDVVENPAADLQGAVESLPVADASFDLVLCIQVLEHADDPTRAVRELRRVVAPGGAVLASTHGVQVYHPAPVDLWRWTHAGLDRLFRENADWSSLSVRPSSGTTACLGMLVAIYADLLARRVHLAPLGRAVTAGLNRGAAALDRRSTDLREPRSGSLIANFHVVAEP
jgi:SAM-dependent methyltransferase